MATCTGTGCIINTNNARKKDTIDDEVISADHNEDTVLPIELWHMIFGYLDVADLCRCCQVCYAWYQLIRNSELSHWQRLYYQTRHGRHPNWPNHSDQDSVSWFHAVQHNYTVENNWYKIQDRHDNVSLLASIRGNRSKRGMQNTSNVLTVTVGENGQFDYDDLMTALQDIPGSQYVRILLHPGNYLAIRPASDLPFCGRKAPLEIIGIGPNCNIIIDGFIYKHGFNMRWKNVTIQTNVFEDHNISLYVKSGHLQLDMCSIDGFGLKIEYPASVHLRYCEIRNNSFICLQKSDDGLIEHCKFVNLRQGILINGFDRRFPERDKRPRSIMFNKYWYQFVIVDNTCYNSWDNSNHTSNSSSCRDDDIIDVDEMKSTVNYMSTPQHNISSDPLCRTIHEVDDNWLANANYNDVPNGAFYNNVAPQLNSVNATVQCLGPESRNYVVSVNDGASASDNITLEQQQLGGGKEEDIYQSVVSQCSHSDDYSTATGNENTDTNRKEEQNLVNYLDLDVHYSLDAYELDDLSSHEYQETLLCHNSDNHSITDILNNSSKSLNLLLAKHIKPPQPKSKELVEESVKELKATLIRNCSFINCELVLELRLSAAVTIVNNLMSSISCAVRCLEESVLYMIDNFITDCQLSGVYIRDKSTGLIDRNIFLGVAEAAIDIRTAANPTIQRNVIEDGRRSGIVIMDDGNSKIVSNMIVRNTESGIHVLHTGKTIICNNIITENGAAGISTGDSGDVFIIDNVIKENQWAGIDVCNGAKPFIFKNQISDGLCDGIVLGDNSGGKLEFNKISANAGVGIHVSLTSSTLIQWNTVCENSSHGILLSSSHNYHFHVYEKIDNEADHDLGSYNVKLNFNVLYRNARFGICIIGYKIALVKGNSIFHNREGGISIGNTLDAKILENDISGNGEYAILIHKDGKASLDGNGLYDNKGCGIKIKGHCTLKNNDLCNDNHCCIEVGNSASSYIFNNRIFSRDSYGISLLEGSQSLIEDNKVYYSNHDAVLRHANCSSTLQNNCCTLHPSSFTSCIPWANDAAAALRPLVTAPLSTPRVSLTALRLDSTAKDCNCGHPSQICTIL